MRRLGRLLTVLTVALCVLPQGAGANPTLLFNPDDGRIFYSEEMDDQWHPASLTKIMTAYLAFEAMRAGKVTFETKLKVSEKAHEQPPSKIGLPVGGELPLETAIKALIVKSANDVAVMIAEGIAGSEEAFVASMNAKARQIGMTRTRFVNPNGLPAADQVTTARDLARLSAAVIRDFPEHAHYWAMPRMQIGKIKLASHNSLLRHFEGANGLKTGFICDSGFNIVASATRGDLRLMAVVLGSPSAGERTDRAEALLQHGFETFGWKQAFATANIGSAPLPGAAKPARSVRTSVKAAACGWRSPRAKRVLSATKKAKEPRAGKGATRQTYTLKPKGPPVAKPTAASKPAKTAPKTAVRRPAEAKARPKSE